MRGHTEYGGGAGGSLAEDAALLRTSPHHRLCDATHGCARAGRAEADAAAMPGLIAREAAAATGTIFF